MAGEDGAVSKGAAEFCRREGVSEAAFYQWRRRLAEADAEAGAEAPASEEPAGFMPVRVVGGAGIEARLPGGTRVLIPTGDPQALQLVIETLARADALRRCAARGRRGMLSFAPNMRMYLCAKPT